MSIPVPEDIQQESRKELPVKKRKWVIVIISIAMLLRLTLGLLNREANDNHVDVVNQIIATHRLPEKSDCWSCYQPKLYYVICAGIVKIFNVDGFYNRIVVMQLVNVFISFFILLIFWMFIAKQKLKDSSKYIVFAFFAFNPCLVGINVQGTNDTLAIFWGILAVYTCGCFFEEFKAGDAIIMIVALLAAMLTKASGVILTGVIAAVMVIKMIAERTAANRNNVLKYFLILVIATIVIIPFAGGYYHNYQKYGSLSISTWEKDPPPFFFKRTFITRQGLRSVFDCFFTFRYVDMIGQPFINNEWNNFPEHRTSLWSQLYGRTVFMHFDQWPPSWQSTKPVIVFIGRVLIISGIIPLILFCGGIFSNLKQFVLRLVKKDLLYFNNPGNYIYLLITVALLFSSMYYTYNYRDFSSMKSIYIFPGLIAFIKMFIDGFLRLKSHKAILAVHVTLMVMVVFSIADIVFLIYQLH